MTIFELVKVALDELYAESREQYASKIDDTIREKLQYLSANYRTLNSADRSPIDYSDPATRFAYVFSYVAAHGDYVVQVLQGIRSLVTPPIFTGQRIRLSCVGGGPGSDVIAFVK